MGSERDDALQPERATGLHVGCRYLYRGEVVEIIQMDQSDATAGVWVVYVDDRDRDAVVDPDELERLA